MTVSEAISYYENKNPKGEYVIVVEGAPEKKSMGELTLEQAVKLVKQLIDDGMKSSEACKKIAKETDFSKSVLYAELIKNEES